MRLGLLLFIGVPGSGKTTTAKYLVESREIHNENKYYFIHVCYDDLIDFKNECQEIEWKAARSLVAAKIEELLLAIKNMNHQWCPTEFLSDYEKIKSKDSNIVIILDDIMYFKSMRYSLYQIARKHEISFCQVFFNCLLEKVLSSNSSREPSAIVPENIIQNIFDKMEPPNPQNNWERFSVVIEAFCNKNVFLDKVFPVLTDSLCNPECVKTDNNEEREFSSLQCKTSVLHQTDIALRSIVGVKVKEFLSLGSNKGAANYSSELNSRKSEILSDIKMGNICLPNEILEEISQSSLKKSKLVDFLNGYF